MFHIVLLLFSNKARYVDTSTEVMELFIANAITVVILTFIDEAKASSNHTSKETTVGYIKAFHLSFVDIPVLTSVGQCTTNETVQKFDSCTYDDSRVLKVSLACQ